MSEFARDTSDDFRILQPHEKCPELGFLATQELVADKNAGDDEQVEEARVLTPEQQDMVLEHMWIVGWQVKKYGGTGAMTKKDLAQEGMVGLCNAALRFDPTRGTSFVTYARIQVSGMMLRAYRDKDKIIRPARRDRKRATAYDQAVADLAESDRPQTELNIAEASGLSLKAVREVRMVRDVRVTHSLDVSLRSPDGGTTTLAEKIADPVMDPFERFDNEDFVSKLFKGLNDKQQAVVRMRHGFPPYDRPHAQIEIGAELGITQMNVSRTLAGVYKQMRSSPHMRELLK